MPQFPIDEDGVPYCPLCNEEASHLHPDAWSVLNEIACVACGDRLLEDEGEMTIYSSFDAAENAADNAWSEKGLLDD